MRGILMWLAVAAVSLPLAGCGGSGGTSVPPITNAGASVRVAGSDLQSGATVTQLQGGDGPGTIYIEEGALRFLGELTATSSATRQFRGRDGQSVALLTVPAGYSDIGLLRLDYQLGGTPFVSEGVFGRFTTAAQMPTAGTATFVGENLDATWIDGNGNSSNLIRGPGSVPIALVVVDFANRDVDASLDFRPTASARFAPVDVIELTDMSIAGNRFSGGTLTSLKRGAVVPEFSTPTPTTSGIFAGPGAAELGGVFYATMPGGQLLTGRYIARQ